MVKPIQPRSLDDSRIDPKPVRSAIALKRDVKHQRLQARERQADEHSRTAARAHKIIAECSHVLVRASEERQLLQDICRIVVDSGGYRVAWVGLVRHDKDRTIEPVASAGDHDNYLGSIKLSWGDNEFGRGPAGMAVRTGKPQAVRDVLTNPNFAAWRDQALARGYQVLASLPLVCDGETLGMFGIFAGESTALDSGELELLGELARDIAYGMQTLRARDAQQRAEQLRELEHAVNRSLANADSASTGLKAVIRAVCETEGWDCGRYFRVDEKAGVLLFAEGWSVPDPAVERFVAGSREVVYRPGDGLSGKAWQLGQPLWSADITRDPRSSSGSGRTGPAHAIGIHGTFVFPVVSDGKTIGVLNFASRKPREPEERLLEAIDVISGQIGQFVRRKQAEDVLRESEERFRSLTGLSSDMYWEQDDQYRFTSSSGSGPEWIVKGYDQAIGKRRWDFNFLNMTAEDWTAHIALLDARKPFQDLELCKLDASGRKVWASVSGEPVFDASGAFMGYRGVGKDITARKRAEELQALEHTVNRSLATADSASAALKMVLRAVCETEGWECGRYFRVDEKAGVLRFADAWSVSDDAVERFVAGSRDLVFPPGVGLSGHAWQSGQPLWSTDLAKDPRSLTGSSRAGRPPDIGLHGAFVFPIVADGKTIGVLNFSSRQPREPEERLLQTISVVGRQIGQFVRRKLAEEVLRESETHYRALSELSADWYWEQDAQFRFTEISGHLGKEPFRREVWLGKTRWELPYVGVSEDDWRAHRATLEAHRPFRDFVMANRRKDGSLQYISTSGYPVFDSAGKFSGYRGIARDVSERKRADEKVRTQALQQRLIAEFGQEALANTDLGGVLDRAVELVSASLKAEYCNVLEMDPDGQRLRYKAAAGWPKEWVGRREVPVKPGNHMEYILSRREPLVVEDYSAETRFSPSPLLQFGVRSSLQVPILRATGVFGIMSVHTPQPRRFTEDEVSFLQSVANILAVAIERKNAEERLTYLAQFDALTGLPNRHLFHDRLVHTMAQAKRSDRPMAVLFIDLDRFKLVNDTQGHRAGDQLLKESAARLAQCVRSSDTVGRFGGDEFGAIVSDLSKPADASLVAQKIIDALARPFELDGHETFISASVGITLFPTDGEEAGALITNADVAMYRAKEQGRNNYQYFTREMNERALERVHMEVALRRAIERREFLLHYQPKVDLKSGAICGLEALLRWQHPKKGLVSPAEFIPVLEDTGLIVPVGEWVMQEACTQVQVWRRAGLAVPPVAVNLSARQFQQKDLEATVRRILQGTGVDAALLELELTESMLMKDPEAAARTLQGLKEAGVKLSVDDFGTGYSSLAYLKRFPIDSLKIDRAFIRDVTLDPDDAAITLAIIGLGHSLKLKVVAEGVETEAQLDFLSAQDCDQMQGFYFARPLPVTDCTQTLIEDRRLKIAVAKNPANVGAQTAISAQ